MTYTETLPVAQSRRPGRVHIGTSGWSYDQWRLGLYAGVPRSRWLAHYAAHFQAVEINASFYHQLRPTTLARWRDVTPDSFRFAIKVNRYLTHVKRLQFDDKTFQQERDQMQPLGTKLAAVLWQMPIGLHFDADRLNAFAVQLTGWEDTRHALEFRHDSWFVDETAEVATKYRLAICQSDAADWPMWNAVTTDLVYVRLHGHRVTYSPAYSRWELEAWARRVRGWRAEGREVHVYLDNTDAGHAPRDAMRLADLVGEPHGKQECAHHPH